MTGTRDALNAFLDLPQVPVKSSESGPLAGLSLGVKDIFDVAGYVTGCGSPKRASEQAPATRTAPAVQALLDAGARFAGKTQTEELAFSMIGQNVHFPHPVNPAAPGRVTGGSSSGSVAAVAGGLADVALGSDTGGSIRAPASFCGLIGLRITHDRVSLAGAMPLAPSLDTVGWFARDMATYEAVAEVLLGADATPRRLTRPLRASTLEALLEGEAAHEYGRMAERVAAVTGPAGALPPPTSDPDELYGCVRRLQAKESWASQGEWVKANGDTMDPATRERFAFGATVPLADAIAEGARRRAFREELADGLGDDGFLVLPTTPTPAPKSGSAPEVFAAFRERAVRMFCWSSLSGFPQLTLPLGTVEGAPFGISLLGPAGSDRALLSLGGAILAAEGAS